MAAIKHAFNAHTNIVSIGKNHFKMPISRSNSISLINKGIWIYFVLLMFEGALRKWFLPGLAIPLLIVRDPIALWILFQAWKCNLLPSNMYVFGSTFIGIASIFTSIFNGNDKLIIALYGARIPLLHFPLIFIIGRTFAKEDILRLGKALLWVSIPMTVLIAVQFYSPQSSMVNRGVGGNVEGAGFSGALGYLRPPGTFSFTNGVTLFYSVVTPFIFYFWLHPKRINPLLLFTSSAALFAAIPLSISRGLLFQVGACIIFMILAISKKPQYLGRMLLSAMGIIVFFLIFSNSPFFQTAMEAFSSRFGAASKSEGGLKGTLIDRFLGEMVRGFTNSFDQPFFGSGSGTGTLAGSQLITGKRQFLVAEGEWGRIIGELGLLMGSVIIFIRLKLTVKMAIISYHKLVRGDMLPWMLTSFGLVCIAQGQWAQPTSLGFCTLIGGLVVASLKNSVK